MVAQAVGLDDQARGSPEEVDLEAIDPGFRLRHGQADFLRQWQEETLETRAREAEGAAVEPSAQTRDTRLARVTLECGAELRRRDEIEPIRLVDHTLHRHPIVTDGEIDDRLRRAGHRDAIERPIAYRFDSRRRWTRMPGRFRSHPE